MLKSIAKRYMRFFEKNDTYAYLRFAVPFFIAFMTLLYETIDGNSFWMSTLCFMYAFAPVVGLIYLIRKPERYNKFEDWIHSED